MGLRNRTTRARRRAIRRHPSQQPIDQLIEADYPEWKREYDEALNNWFHTLDEHKPPAAGHTWHLKGLR